MLGDRQALDDVIDVAEIWLWVRVSLEDFGTAAILKWELGTSVHTMASPLSINDYHDNYFVPKF